MRVHPSHDTRISDASTYDEICKNCGATDGHGEGLKYPCPKNYKRAKAHGQELTEEESRQLRWQYGHGEQADLVKQVEFLSQEIWLLKQQLKK